MIEDFSGRRIVDIHELPGRFDGQGPKEDGVDDGEDRGVGADAQAECEDSDDGEACGLAQHAESKAQILC